MLEIAFHADRDNGVPLPRQLADHLATLIETGRLPRGTRLPATRDVAASVGVARKVVTAAYEVLAGRGLVTAHVGRGTFVSGTALPAPADATPSSTPRRFAWAGLFARGARSLPAALLRPDPSPIRFDFRGGRIDPATLPLRELRWAFARPFETRARLAEVAAHLDPHGWPALRREIARHLTTRGIACTPSDVLVVNGLQQAIDLTARVLVDPGDAVAMEQPGYFGAALAFLARGADVLGVDVDADGIDTTQLARILRLRRVKLVYVTPATQSPTGVSLSPARRAALMALADEHQVPVFEDDYDVELRYGGPTRPALKATDSAGQVVYAGTFSKALFPSLRVGYVVAARPLLERMVAARVSTDFGTGAVDQAALASLLATRGLERHVRRMRTRYAERLRALVAALTETMPAGTRWSTPGSGLIVWLRLPAGVDPERIHQAATAAGIAYSRGDLFHLDGRGTDHLALSFAVLEPAAIADGVARLGAIVRAETTAGAGRIPRRRSAARRVDRPATRTRRRTHADR